MDAGVDAVTEGDVVRELVQLAVDRDLAGVGAGVGRRACCPSSVGTTGFGITKLPSKKNFNMVMQAPATAP